MYNYTRGTYYTLPLEQVCAANTTFNFANCFGFNCTINPHKVGQQQLATCHCPIGSAFDGTVYPVGQAFLHEAGQCISNYCEYLPVGRPPDSDPTGPWQCLGIPPPL